MNLKKFLQYSQHLYVTLRLFLPPQIAKLKKYYDHDSKATDAIIDLYNNNIDISQISKVLSMGMVGRKKNRKLVPTKWSITAADDILSLYLMNKIKNNPILDNNLVFDFNHLENYYSVVFIPDNVWSFEMIESWIDTNGRIHIGSDYESGKRSIIILQLLVPILQQDWQWPNIFSREEKGISVDSERNTS